MHRKQNTFNLHLPIYFFPLFKYSYHCVCFNRTRLYTPEVKQAVVLYMHVLNQVTIMPLTADLEKPWAANAI
jgi:hypothetical protein